MNRTDAPPRRRPHPFLPSWPGAIVDLAATARVFDLIRDQAPQSLLGLVSVANGFHLRRTNPREAKALLRSVWRAGRPEFICPRSLTGVAKKRLDDPTKWNTVLRSLLKRENPNIELPESEHLMLAGVQVGLTLDDFPRAARQLEEHLQALDHETRFVATRLAAWSGRKLRRPRMHPFTEYCVSFEPAPEAWLRQALKPAIDRTAAVVLHFPQPWHLGSWSWSGWGFARTAAFATTAKAIAASPRSKSGVLQGDAALYASTVGAVSKGNKDDEPVDILQALFLYLEQLDQGKPLADYRARRHPRHLARLAFEFAYRMGLHAPPTHARTVSTYDRQIHFTRILDGT